VCYLSANSIVAVTGYGDIREYDLRGQRRPVIATSLAASREKQFLSRVISSPGNANIIYVASQEGHLYVMDKRKAF